MARRKATGSQELKIAIKAARVEAERLVFVLGGWVVAGARLSTTPEGLKRAVFASDRRVLRTLWHLRAVRDRLLGADCLAEGNLEAPLGASEKVKPAARRAAPSKI